MGIDIAEAALAAGHQVVTTGRNTDTVADALDEDDDLLAVKLAVTGPEDAEAAAKAAPDRFGRIDLVRKWVVSGQAKHPGGAQRSRDGL